MFSLHKLSPIHWRVVTFPRTGRLAAIARLPKAASQDDRRPPTEARQGGLRYGCPVAPALTENSSCGRRGGFPWPGEMLPDECCLLISKGIEGIPVAAFSISHVYPSYDPAVYATKTIIDAVSTLSTSERNLFRRLNNDAGCACPDRAMGRCDRIYPGFPSCVENRPTDRTSRDMARLLAPAQSAMLKVPADRQR
jgi:hypothetical protein